MTTMQKCSSDKSSEVPNCRNSLRYSLKTHCIKMIIMYHLSAKRYLFQRGYQRIHINFGKKRGFIMLPVDIVLGEIGINPNMRCIFD